MYINGMGFRSIEDVTIMHETTAIYWVKQIVTFLPDAPKAMKFLKLNLMSQKCLLAKKNLATDSSKSWVAPGFQPGFWVIQAPKYSNVCARQPDVS